MYRRKVAAYGNFCMILPPELLQHISLYCNTATHCRLLQTCKRLYRLLEQTDRHFSPKQLLKAIDNKNSQQAVKWMKSEHFQSQYFSGNVHVGFGRISVYHQLLIKYTLLRGIPDALTILVRDCRVLENYSDQVLYHYATYQHPEDLSYNLFQILYDSQIGLDADAIIDMALSGRNRRIIQCLTEEVSDYHRFDNVLKDVWYWGDVEYFKKLMNYSEYDERYLPGIVSRGFATMSVALLEFVMQGRDFSQVDFLDAFLASLETVNVEVAGYLLPHVHVNKNGHIALFWMCIYGQFDLLRQILADNRLQYPSKEDLFQKSDLEIFAHLLKDKSVTKTKYSAGEMQFGPYCVSSIQIAELLLSHGADPTRLLGAAIKYDAIDIVQHLLSRDDLVFPAFQDGLLVEISDKKNPNVLKMLLDDPRTDMNVIHRSLSKFVDYSIWNLVRCTLSHPRLAIQQDVSQMTDLDMELLSQSILSEDRKV